MTLGRDANTSWMKRARGGAVQSRIRCGRGALVMCRNTKGREVVEGQDAESPWFKRDEFREGKKQSENKVHSMLAVHCGVHCGFDSQSDTCNTRRGESRHKTAQRDHGQVDAEKRRKSSTVWKTWQLCDDHRHRREHPSAHTHTNK